jgi:hypothetical protein
VIYPSLSDLLRLTVTNDAGYELVMAVASGTLNGIADVAEVLPQNPSRSCRR